MWSSTFSSDGDPDPDLLRRMSAPDNEIPVAVPLNVLLARTEDVAVALLGLQVFTTGLSFDLALRSRSGRNGRDLDDLLFEHRPHRSGSFLLGIELSDGRRQSSAPGAGWGADPWPRSDADVVFHAGGGGGGDRSVDQSWWLSPLPPEGPLTVVVRCDALGLGETTTVLDATAISRRFAETRHFPRRRTSPLQASLRVLSGQPLRTFAPGT
jgi:hypothetical protein